MIPVTIKWIKLFKNHFFNILDYSVSFLRLEIFLYFFQSLGIFFLWGFCNCIGSSSVFFLKCFLIFRFFIFLAICNFKYFLHFKFFHYFLFLIPLRFHYLVVFLKSHFFFQKFWTLNISFNDIFNFCVSFRKNKAFC